jgi:outer membrane protein assembly factor BamB
MQPYNPLRFLFYPFVLTVLFGTIYFIYHANPALLDQLSLIELQKSQRKTEGFWIEPISDQAGSTTPTGLRGSEPGNASHLPTDLRIEFRFEPTEFPVEWPNKNAVVDQAGIVAVLEKSVTAYDLAGQIVWTFALPADEVSAEGRPQTTGTFVVIATQSGKVLALRRSDGRVAWIRDTALSMTRTPHLTGATVLVFGQRDTGEKEPETTLIRVATGSGQEISRINKFSDLAGSEIATHEGKNLLPALGGKGLLKVWDLQKGTPLWSNDFAQEFVASPVVFGDRVLIVSRQGQMFLMDIVSGRQVWELDLKADVKNAPAILPGIGIGVVADTQNYLHVLDLQTGKRKWRYGLQTTGRDYRFVAARMTEAAASRLNMTADAKGWAFWGPCGTTALCAFEPFKGFLLKKLELEKAPLGPPAFADSGNELFQLVASGKGFTFKRFIEKRKLDVKADAKVDAKVDKASTEP